MAKPLIFRDHAGKEHIIEVGPSQTDKAGEKPTSTSMSIIISDSLSLNRKCRPGQPQSPTLSKEEIAELAVSGDIRAPFKGNVCEISVKEGQEVSKGDRVAILEAMKMQTPVVSEVAGTVVSISAKIGQAVQPGDKILKIDPAE